MTAQAGAAPAPGSPGAERDGTAAARDIAWMMRTGRAPPGRSAARARALPSAPLGTALALPATEGDPAEQQHSGHVRSTADIDRRTCRLDHFIGGGAGRGGLSVVMPGQDLRGCTNAHFVDQTSQILIARIDTMAARR